jgi:uncharacterized protein (TIGR02001 family)
MPKYVLFAALLLLSAPAAAQDSDDPVVPVEADAGQDADMGAPATFDVSGEVDLLSDYRFRGVSRSDEDPAVQAALNLSHASGLYVGARGTTLQGVDGFRLRDPAFRDFGDVELDLYAGYGAQLGGGFSADAGLLYYLFLGGEGSNDHVEPYASLSYLIGPAEFTAGAKYAPSQDAIGNEDMLYLFGQADVSIPFRPWRFSALVGHQDWGTYGSYWTWSLGVEHRLSLGRGADVEIGLRYVDTSLGATPGADAGLVASAGFSF